jgi:hypothetical protein
VNAKQLAEIAARHGVGVETARALFEGLRKSGGTLVQFDAPELGGMGQWMPGMTMVGKMGDHALKAKVDALCADLAEVARAVGETTPEANPHPPTPTDWWPADYGKPGSTGGQNGARYAYFASRNRLLVERDGSVTAYDTTGYTVHGAGQQQANAAPGTLTLATDKGPIPVDDLPVVG